MSLVQTPGTEPPMYLQRPSSGRSQDISHVLASTFRELFTRDVVTPDTVKYLNTSRHGDDVYHERYVEDLRKIQAERERRMQEVSMLERHIIQARARATSADERALNRVAEGYNTYHDLGLPPVRSHFCYLLDSDLLKRHGLLVPEHFSTQEPPPQNPPEPVELPNYARDTLTFHEHVSTSPVDDGYDDPDELPRKEVKRSPKTRVTPEESRPKTIKEGLREVWKEAMPPVSRVQERSVLANLEERHNFLRNPRHIPPSAPHGGRTLVKKKKKLPKLVGGRSVYVEESPAEKEPAVVFVASPSEVVFRQYSVGQVYEMILDLKNVTTASRQCRVIPPKTSYFSVGLGQFPGDQGIVAPGMSCQYTVRFAPDSLADYDDCVQVQTQSATPMYIKIKGRREPPALTLPSVLDCGHCLVGGCRVVQFLCRNDGGPGRFCLMPKNLWPTANYRSISTPGRVELAPFEVRPAVFQLMPGEAILLEILFAPTSIKTFNQAVTMVCDNCQVKHFTVKGVGQTAGVEMMMVAGGESEPLPGEILDATARHLVRFDSVHPMTFAQRTMAIRNTTDVELPFHWQIVKPTLEPPDAGEGEKVSENIECYPDVGTAFSVIPEGGVLQPSNTEEFLVTFAPTQEETSYNSVLHMILHHIPEVPHPEDDTPRDRPPTPEGKVDMHRQKSSDSLASQSSSKTSEDGLRLRDVIALEVELKGTCRTFNVLLDPYAIIVPGQLLMSTVVKKHFRMINTSQWMLSFSWESLSDPHILEVEPPAGHIEAGDVMEMQLSITGGRPGVLEHRLLCHIQNRSEPISLYIRANIKGPEVIIETPSLDFGLVQPGDVVVREIHIRNTCQIRAAWSLQESAAFLEAEDGNVLASEFELTPSSGELPPLGSLAVRAVFKPARCRSVRTVFVLMVPNGPDSHVAAQVEVQTPQVCLMSCQLVIDEIYTDVPVRREITLLNQTLLETDFAWGQPEGPHADRCSVEFGTPSGHLGPREKVNITVTFTGHTQSCRFAVAEAGDVMEMQLSITGGRPGVLEHRLLCHIQNRSEPISLYIRANIKGPEVIIETPSLDFGLVQPGDVGPEVIIETPSLDFGLVQPGDVVVREIHIRNTCQIRAAWSLQESAAFLETEDGNVLASEFELTPSSGELPPLGSLAVRAVFKPARCRSVRTVFVLMVPNGPDSHVSAQVEVQTPQVCLMSCQLVIDEIYTDVPVRREITLLNQTLLETDFTWGQPEGPHADRCSVEFGTPSGHLGPREKVNITVTFTGHTQPEGPHADRCSVEFGTPSGHLGPREKVNITVTFTGHTQGEISEVRIPCQIQGMADPVYLTVFCQVRGLTVSYNVSKEPELQGEDERNDLVLDFGTDVEIHGNPRRFLHITNHTAIVAPFSIHVDYFHARPPSPPGQKAGIFHPVTKGSRRQLLGRTPNIADPLSKTPSKSQVDFSQALLRDGRGAAFLVQPAAGVLMPFHTVTVEITSYSDIWGQYQDHLICKVKDLAPMSIPVRMTVVGCPLNFQMTAAFRDQQPVVRYGTHVSGVAPIARTMRVNNPCPYAIRLDWQSYNHRQQDPQLLDLMVSYGQDFPLRDAHGEEIIPPEFGSSRRQLLGRTPNIADPLSKTPSKSQVDFSQALLRDGRGAAFLVQPAAGVLMPFHTVTVEITSYSDIWGQYKDHLICKVKDLAPVSIPVRMTVVGCPLNFQMTAAFRDQQPVVRYGTHVSGVAPIARTMRVNNPCPYAIRLDWQSYNHRQQDPQLLDLMVSYGQDFPLRDAHGDEIVPPEVKESPRRPFETPDTLGTTPALGEVVEDEPTDSPQEEAQAPGRRKVVLVNLRPHEGQRANQPYDITPKQLVIPARSHGNIKVTFTPLHNQDVDTGIDCNAFALGFMSLDSKVALSVPSKVSRVQGYQMTPLRLEMTAHVKPAQLTLEPADEEGMVYYTAASDLMQQGQLSSEFLKTTSCTVTNKTETPLQFRLVTTPPFLLTGVEVAGVRGRAFARTQASGFYTLNPRQNMKVSLAFRVSMDLVQLVDKLAGWREGDKMWLTHHGGERRLHFTQNMVIEFNNGTTQYGRERRLHFTQNMVIEFNNGTTQNLPLRASLVVPSISLSTEAVDFGVCMVEQEREMDILIANPTASDCYWTATIESRDDDQAFQVMPASGLLQGALSHIAQNKALLKLNFTARHSKAFECVIIFQGVLGEEVRRLQVKGHGSYDGRHEAIMDI
ncbi:PREDICTED: deleted in lung and esophageal cancer protein 1-like [Branchiostoma belcheri]|uniref:Deleted in lung and esophageal cancer protein 1-like n=1 Tax=Branchiostoma belcheri TaxID=7741 RepID=A0A6P4YD41_BRABE|nr:PREDICTED: deleted in lung and esophageal cancer protein 1-like [Branchiostoma belcheri]